MVTDEKTKAGLMSWTSMCWRYADYRLHVSDFYLFCRLLIHSVDNSVFHFQIFVAVRNQERMLTRTVNLGTSFATKETRGCPSVAAEATCGRKELVWSEKVSIPEVCAFRTRTNHQNNKSQQETTADAGVWPKGCPGARND